LFYSVTTSTLGAVLGNTQLNIAPFSFTSNRAPGIVVLSSTFAFVGKNSSSGNLFFCEFFNTGVRFGPVKTIAASLTGSALLDSATVRFNGSYFSITGTLTTEGCGGNSDVFMLTFEYSGAMRGIAVVFSGASQDSLTGLSSVITVNGLIVITYSDSATARPSFFGVYDTLRKSIIGVAQEPAVANASFRVATQGIFSTNQTIGFGGNFNTTASTVPGARGTLVGTSVSLNGLS
jgi:hypothetical protein